MTNKLSEFTWISPLAQAFEISYQDGFKKKNLSAPSNSLKLPKTTRTFWKSNKLGENDAIIKVPMWLTDSDDTVRPRAPIGDPVRPLKFRVAA